MATPTPQESIRRAISSTEADTPSARVTAPVNVAWFGAVLNGVADDSSAVQAAINHAIANNLNTIFFPPGTCYFGSSVVISTANFGLRLTGISSAGYLGAQRGSIVTGANGLAALFLLSASTFGVEIDHLSFDGVSPSTGVVSAIKSTAEGAPARPVNIHNCHFLHFDKSIYSLLVAGGVPNTGICQVNVHENAFYGGNYAVYGAGDGGAVMNLSFEGNVSEGGAKIFIGDNGAGGTLRIVSNIMEGQADAINISAGLCKAVIESNYFEQNTGYIVKFVASNGGSSLRMGPNYYLGSTSGRVYADNCEFICDDQLNGVCYVSGQLLTNQSRFKQNKHFLDATSQTNFAMRLDTSMLFGQEIAPASLTAGTLSIAGSGNFAPTPSGMRSSERFTTNSGTFSVSSSLSVADWVIVTAMFRQVNSTAQSITCVIYDNTVTGIGQTQALSAFYTGNDNRGWVVMHFGVKVTAISTGNFRVRFTTDTGGQVDVADFYTYKQAISDTTTPIYIYLPSSERSGLATLLSGNSSIVVTHGMDVTPTIVHATAQKNVGGIYVDTIGATQFTVRTESAAPADTVIMWTAN